MRLSQLAVALSFIGLCAAAQSQTKWDMPTAYPANNFHTENVQQFAADEPSPKCIPSESVSVRS